MPQNQKKLENLSTEHSEANDSSTDVSDEEATYEYLVREVTVIRDKAKNMCPETINEKMMIIEGEGDFNSIIEKLTQSSSCEEEVDEDDTVESIATDTNTSDEDDGEMPETHKTDQKARKSESEEKSDADIDEPTTPPIDAKHKKRHVDTVEPSKLEKQKTPGIKFLDEGESKKELDKGKSFEPSTKHPPLNDMLPAKMNSRTESTYSDATDTMDSGIGSTISGQDDTPKSKRSGHLASLNAIQFIRDALHTGRFSSSATRTDKASDEHDVPNASQDPLNDPVLSTEDKDSNIKIKTSTETTIDRTESGSDKSPGKPKQTKKEGKKRDKSITTKQPKPQLKTNDASETDTEVSGGSTGSSSGSLTTTTNKTSDEHVGSNASTLSQDTLDDQVLSTVNEEISIEVDISVSTDLTESGSDKEPNKQKQRKKDGKKHDKSIPTKQPKPKSKTSDTSETDTDATKESTESDECDDIYGLVDSIMSKVDKLFDKCFV